MVLLKVGIKKCYVNLVLLSSNLYLAVAKALVLWAKLRYSEWLYELEGSVLREVKSFLQLPHSVAAKFL